MEIRLFKLSLLASALVLAAVLLAGPMGGPAWAQDGEDGDDDAPVIDQSEDGGAGEQYNSAAIDCEQILLQIGGDQYATASGGSGADGDGDGSAGDDSDAAAEEDQEEGGTASNEQQLTAEQIQRCIAIAGNDNNENDSDTDEQAPVDDEQGDVDNEVDRDKPLPNTGGMSLFSLAAFAGGAVLLVVGGVALLVYGLWSRRPGRL